MNSAARINQQVIAYDWVTSVLLNRSQLLLISLVVATLISALSIVYVTHSSRNLTADIQQTLAERNQMHIQWGQLLLEKSTWTMQARVQHLAENKLGMEVPDNQSVVIVNE